MRRVPVRAANITSALVLERVQAEFAEYCTLADLMAWCARQAPRAHIDEIISQDEYTHDVILPFGAVFLSFDTT